MGQDPTSSASQLHDRLAPKSGLGWTWLARRLRGMSRPQLDTTRTRSVPEKVDRTRPHAMAIFLLGAHVKARVARCPHPDPSLQGNAALLHHIRHSLQADDAVEPARRE